jgi:YggT family protein
VHALFFVIDLLAFLLIGACLLRAWMIATSMTMVVQPGRFVVAVTDWLVQPLRRLLPQGMALGRWDAACLLAALILAFAYGGMWTAAALTNMSGTISGAAMMAAVPVAALKMLLRVVLQGLFYMLLMYAVLSWVQPQSPAFGVLSRLLEPVLSPFQRAIPRIGGVDLSALALMLVLQVLLGLVS